MVIVTVSLSTVYLSECNGCMKNFFPILERGELSLGTKRGQESSDKGTPYEHDSNAKAGNIFSCARRCKVVPALT